MNRDRQGRQTPSRARRLFADNLPIPGNPTLGATLDTSDEFVASNGSQSPSNDILNNIPGDIPTTEPSNRRKRGPSKGIGEWERGQKQMVLTTNEHGQPMGPGKVMEAFQTRAGIIARRDIPICYLDWRNVPQTFKDDAIKCLGVQFRYDYQESIDSIYTRKKINEAWRNYKHELYVEYVKDQNSTMVKEGPPPRGIPIEDWRQFVDNCHSLKFQSSSEKNTINRGKQKMPSCCGRRTAAVVRHNMAIEKGVPDSEIGRSATYAAIHTKKDKTPQCPEIMESINNHISSNPESQAMSANDAVVMTLGPDSRGRLRGMGTGVCKTQIRMMDPLLKKNVVLTEVNLDLQKKIENMEAKMDANMAETRAQMNANMAEVRAMLMSQGRASSPTTHSTSPFTHSSSQAVAMDSMNIGKECSLLGGWPPRIVAKGIVEEVTPFNEFGQRRLGEGNYKVYVNVIHDPNGLLPCPHDQYFTTLGQIGQGSVIWPKKYLEFQS